MARKPSSAGAIYLDGNAPISFYLETVVCHLVELNSLISSSIRGTKQKINVRIYHILFSGCIGGRDTPGLGSAYFFDHVSDFRAFFST